MHEHGQMRDSGHIRQIMMNMELPSRRRRGWFMDIVKEDLERVGESRPSIVAKGSSQKKN